MSVFIDRIRVVLRYMQSYLKPLMSNINNRNKLQCNKFKLIEMPRFTRCTYFPLETTSLGV